MNTNWDATSVAAREAFRSAVLSWIAKARIANIQIQGPNAELPRGFLASDFAVEPHVVSAMMQAGVPQTVARAFASELAGAWKEWSDGLRMSLPGAFPSFAAFPGPSAPPTPTAQGGFALSNATSPGEYRLRAALLETRLLSALKAAGPGNRVAGKAVHEFAAWVESSFSEWKERTQIIGIMGKGPIPSFAPPYVPVGPVVGGDNIAMPGQMTACLAGPRFGKVVIGR